MADRTKSPEVIAYAQRLVLMTDIAFTATGAGLIAVSGNMMANNFGGVDGASWLTLGWWLFIASGVIWLTILIPIQLAQTRLARSFRGDAPSRAVTGAWPSRGPSSGHSQPSSPWSTSI